MPDSNPGLMTILTEALERTGPAERAAYLDRACGDAELRKRVDELLAAHPAMGRFLEPARTAAFEPERTAALSSETGTHLPEGATGTRNNTPPENRGSGAAAGAVYVGCVPEPKQATLSRRLTAVIEAVLRRWGGPLPRLCYVTDADNNGTAYYRDVLRRMRHPRTHT